LPESDIIKSNGTDYFKAREEGEGARWNGEGRLVGVDENFVGFCSRLSLKLFVSSQRLIQTDTSQSIFHTSQLNFDTSQSIFDTSQSISHTS
jgi:hypothetical protein